MDLDVRFEDLRYQIEQQIKRRLIRMREEFLSSLGKKSDLERLLAISLISFTPLFKNILKLYDPDHAVTGTLFTEFCTKLGLDEKPFFDIWAIKTGEKRYRKNKLIELFDAFTGEIEILASRIETIERT